MTTNHTPGPWIAVGRWVGHPRDDIPDICTTAPEAMDQDGRSDAECRANARLIAAAPDLLRALRKCVRLVPPSDETAAHLRAARIAIAKATGGKA